MHDIRLAAVDDIPVIARHRVRMFEDMALLPPAQAPVMFDRTVRFLERAIPSGEYVGWLAVSRDAHGSVAGGAGLQTRTVLPFPFGGGAGAGVGTGREALVINVYTEPESRMLGLARRLMEALIDWSRAAGIERIALHASPSGRPLYDGLGFVSTNEMRLMLLTR
ncbi:MAG TPA: GNAT family N-acetyltransferase [Gemmatimonadales bacterium]|nr:GNAT family N-acetyltransferase [Gemmatimonadales bacterium]